MYKYYCDSVINSPVSNWLQSFNCLKFNCQSYNEQLLLYSSSEYDVCPNLCDSMWLTQIHSTSNVNGARGDTEWGGDWDESIGCKLILISVDKQNNLCCINVLIGGYSR